MELIVVLAILGLSAVVVSTVRPSGGGATTPDDVVLRARQMAVQRAQVLTLRLDDTGGWAVTTTSARGVAEGDSVASGRGAFAPSAALAITIDAMGSCHPEGGDAGARFDPLRCQWVPTDRTP